MAVDIIRLIFGWRDHPYVASVKTTGCRREPTVLEELSGQTLAIRRPTDDVILQIDEAIRHSVDNTTDSWRRRSFDVSKDVVQT